MHVYVATQCFEREYFGQDQSMSSGDRNYDRGHFVHQGTAERLMLQRGDVGGGVHAQTVVAGLPGDTISVAGHIFLPYQRHSDTRKEWRYTPEGCSNAMVAGLPCRWCPDASRTLIPNLEKGVNEGPG